MHRPLAFAVVAVVSVALSSCASAPAPAAPATSVERAVVPIDTTEWPARAASVYSAYTRIVNAAAMHRHGSITAAERLLSPAQYRLSVTAIDSLRATGRTQVGRVVTRDFTVQAVEPAGATLSAYVCVDLSESKIVDARRKVVPLPDRRTGTLLVRFDMRGDTARIIGSTTWSGSSVC